MSKRPEEMAMCMMESLAEFAKQNPRYLGLVRVVIFQPQMVQAYFSEMEAVSKGKTSFFGSVTKAFKRMFGEIK